MSNVAVFDIEADGLLYEATAIHCIGINKQVYTDIPAALEELSRYDKLVGHNICGYDLPLIWKLHKWKPSDSQKVVDTMLLSQLLHPDVPDGQGHSLRAWGERLGEAKDDYDGGWEAYNEAMGTYCLQDVEVTRQLYLKLRDDARKRGGKWQRALHIEQTFATDFAWQGFRGVKVNRQHARDTLAYIIREMRRLEREVAPQLPTRQLNKGEQSKATPPVKQFNKDGQPSKLCRKWFDDVWEEHEACDMGQYGVSTWYGRKGNTTVELPCHEPILTEVKATLKDSAAIKEWLMDNGWVPTMWNYKKEKDDNGKMRVMRVKGQPVVSQPRFHDKGVVCPNLEKLQGMTDLVSKVVRWVVLQHRRGFVRGVLNNMRPDGTVPAEGQSLGTPTARVTHKTVANVPKAHDDNVLLGTEMRQCFIARGVMVGVDASGLELRMLAHYVNNPEFTKLVLDGNIHNKLAEAYGRALDKEVSKQDGKPITYGLLYGAQDAKTGETATGRADTNAGAALRAAFVSALPGLDKLMAKIEYAAKQGYVTLIDGRRIRVRMAHSTLNTLLQGSGSIVVKVATNYMNQKIREQQLKAFQVIHYHDEVQLDAMNKEQGQAAGQLFVDGLRLVGKRWLNCPLDGEVKLGKTWADTH